MKYSPADILRKFVVRNCIEHMVATSEHAVWFNLTFWENVTEKAYANKCWRRLVECIRRREPGFRLVGVWARQGRGAWHVHAVCNRRFDFEWLRGTLTRCGFGHMFHLREIDNRVESPRKIARYISGYATDKNALDPIKDKGVRRLIFVGPAVRIMDMRYRSALKRVTSAGRDMVMTMDKDEYDGLSNVMKDLKVVEWRKRSWETWGEWYRRNREWWFHVGWQLLKPEEQDELVNTDDFLRAYLETGAWSYV